MTTKALRNTIDKHL